MSDFHFQNVFLLFQPFLWYQDSDLVAAMCRWSMTRGSMLRGSLLFEAQYIALNLLIRLRNRSAFTYCNCMLYLCQLCELFFQGGCVFLKFDLQMTTSQKADRGRISDNSVGEQYHFDKLALKLVLKG